MGAASSIDDDWMDNLPEEHPASDDLSEEDEVMVDPTDETTSDSTDDSSEQFGNNPLVKKVRIAEMIQKRNENSIYQETTYNQEACSYQKTNHLKKEGNSEKESS